MNILATISLDEISICPSSTFYLRISPFYKSYYQPDERIVLENFAPMSLDFLEHVYQVIFDLDISPSFILVKTNRPETENFFQSQQRPIPVINTPGQAPELGSDYKPIFNTANHLCAHAWSGIHVDPDGKARLCCEYRGNIQDRDGREFNIKTDDIDDIIDSDYMIAIRNEFRSGVTPPGCFKCEFFEKNNIVSKRRLSKFKLKNLYHHINWEQDRIAGKNLFIGGHLGNICNLKCRICNEKFSSQIANEKIKSGMIVDSDVVAVNLVERNWKLSNPFFWKKLRDLGGRARNFEFLGGEPLLLKENLDFMQYLIDAGISENCIFEFITNGTQYPEIFDHADRFQRLTITISIDDLGPRFEFQRKNSHWDTVSQNIMRFIRARDRSQSMEIGVSITVNIQNVLYLPDLIRWLNSQGVDHYFYNFLSTPEFLSVDQLTPRAKELVLHHLRSADLAGTDREKMTSVISMVEMAKTSSGENFLKYMQSLDQLRQEKFHEHHKDIAIAMGYQV